MMDRITLKAIFNIINQIKGNNGMKQLILLAIMTVLLAGGSLTPKPIAIEDVELRSLSDLAETMDTQEVVSGPIDMYEAMARAMKYNLESRLKLMETGLAMQQRDVAKFDMLPKLVASAGYNDRDNYSGSSSMALEGDDKGRESLVSSTSQDKDHVTSDVTLMWNVLDFGLSYVRAQQEGDKVLIAEERKRKTIQNILQDVRGAYWKAASSEVLMDDMIQLLADTKMALDRSRQIEQGGLAAPREALEYQRALLENISFLKGIIQQMRNAKTELARLMNVRSTCDFSLVVPTQFDALPMINLPLTELERLALGARPELHEEDYRARITSLEARKALLQAFPNLNFQAGINTDTNSFLHNNQWWEAGARVSLNLFKLLSQPAVYRAVEAQQKVDHMRRQALSMAILTQVHLSYDGFQQSRERFGLSEQLEQINRRLNELTLAEQQSNVGNELALIRSQTSALVTRMRKIMAYADLQQSLSQIINTVGLDILPEKVDDASVKEVKNSIRQAVEQVERLLAAKPKSVASIFITKPEYLPWRRDLIL